MTSLTFEEESATRYLHGQKGMKGHTFPRATVLTAGNDTLDKIMLLPLQKRPWNRHKGMTGRKKLWNAMFSK